MARSSSSSLPVIAHIMPWSGMGGVEVATLRLITSTRSRFQHVVFVLPDARELRGELEAMGIRVVLYTPPAPSLRHGLRFLRQSLPLVRALRAHRVNLAHFADLKAAYHTSLAARLAGCRTLCHVRVSTPRLSRHERVALWPVQHYVFVSEEARRNFALHLPRKRTTVLYDAFAPPELPPGVAEEVRRELGIAMDRPVVGMVARVSPQKDYLTLANAAAAVLEKRPEVLFVVVGDNSDVELNRQHFALVQERLRTLEIEQSFLFTGHRTDVARLTCAMDLCLLVTHREGFPLSILETMSLGKPVIATDVGGISEIIHPPKTGWLHAHEDSRELADKVLHLLEHPKEAHALGQRAAGHVRQRYTPEIFAAELTAMYGKLLQR